MIKTPALHGRAWRVLWKPGDLTVVKPERRYSPDQPRDDHGRFGETGGTAWAKASPEKQEAMAKQHFGVTDTFKEAGYLTPDGSMLDLSGRHSSGGYRRVGEKFVATNPAQDYLAGQRSTDHREVYDLVGRGGVEGMDDMLMAGFVRVMPEQPGVTIGVPMTDSQRATLVPEIMQQNDGFSITVEPRDRGVLHDQYKEVVTAGDVIKMINTANAVAAGTTKGNRV